MIIVLKQEATQENIAELTDHIQNAGLNSTVVTDDFKKLICIIGEKGKEKLKSFLTLDYVEKVIPIIKENKLSDKTLREHQLHDTVVDIKGACIGGDHFNIIAGPCSIQDEENTVKIVSFLKTLDIKFFRGGIYKPRTSPYAFQGLRENGLSILKTVQDMNMRVVSEVVDPRHIEAMLPVVDVFQVGTRNMANFELLKELAKIKKPVLFKRGNTASLKEYLMAAEYLLSGGNPNVILCERGIKGYDTEYRNVFDINAIPTLKKMTHLPIIADPSHATGRRDLVTDISMAATVVGCHGLIVEMHDNPELALSDGYQTLNFEQFTQLVEKVKRIRDFVRLLEIWRK